MIWRGIGCDHRISRHDEPRVGMRSFWCKPCHKAHAFVMRPQDQPRPQMARRKVNWKAPAAGSFRKGEFLEHDEPEGFYDDE
jgi:hypothetical protein